MRSAVGTFREKALVEQQAIPWISDSICIDNGVSAFRVLVCGKTGVGKSTLINRLFGVELVQLPLKYLSHDAD